MSKDNDLSKLTNALPAELSSPVGDFQSLTSTGAFLRVNVMQGLSALVQSKKSQIGDLTIENGFNFGENFKALVVGWRPRAIVLGSAGMQAESFVQRSQTWKDIESQARSKVKDDGARPSFGPEFLLWIPPTDGTIVKEEEGGKLKAIEDTFSGFITFHYSKTLRRRADSVMDCMGEQEGRTIPGWGYFSSEKVDGKSHTWFVANAIKLADPPSDLPDTDLLVEALTAFMKPVMDEKKALEQAESGSRPR